MTIILLTKRDYKAAPLLEMLNERFKIYNFSEQLSIDESMCKYFGKHSAKQFMRQKPICFGFKFWVLAASSGYLYHMDLYTRKDQNVGTGASTALGSRVVERLLEHVPANSARTVFFDNFFYIHRFAH